MRLVPPLKQASDPSQRWPPMPTPLPPPHKRVPACKHSCTLPITSFSYLAMGCKGEGIHLSSLTGIDLREYPPLPRASGEERRALA